MNIYAISDLHLSLTANKPMDVFGDNWQQHHLKIKENWLNTVKDDDLVLIAGDISWALKLDTAQDDLDWLGELPGQKVAIKGNHDYWWSSMKKISDATNDSIHFIQNNSFSINGVTIGGSRLWDYPYIYWPGPVSENPVKSAKPQPTDEERQKQIADNQKICANELSRLCNSLNTMDQQAQLRICLTHYPPLSRQPAENELTAIISEYNIDYCIYGHLHALEPDAQIPAADCTIGKTRYLLTSCDWLDFKPLLIAQV